MTPSVIRKQLESSLMMLQQGDLIGAEQTYRNLINAGQQRAEIYCNLAIICGLTNRRTELFELLNKALTIKPDYAEAHNNLGIALHEQGNFDAARHHYQRAIRLRPDYAEAHFNHGNLLMDSGNSKAAVPHFKQALALRPNYVDALTNLGHSQLRSGDRMAALASFWKALEANPGNPELRNNFATANLHTGRIDIAIAELTSVLTHHPNNANALLNLALAYKQAGRHSEATSACQDALKKHPNDAAFHNLLGILKRDINQHHGALTCYQQALQIEPGNPEYLCNLGNTLHAIGDIKGAIHSYAKALAKNQEFNDAKLNLAMCYLLLGSYEEGLQLYEARLSAKTNPDLFQPWPSGPLWDGQAIENSETLLVVSEQGIGDTLQMMRYIPLLRKRHHQVRVVAPQKLHGLLIESAIEMAPLLPEEVGNWAQSPWIGMMSLPHQLGVRSNAVICSEPYIRTQKQLIAAWGSRLRQENEILVGLNWQGNPLHETTISRGRSLALEDFAPLSNYKNVRFVSLQKGFGSEQLTQCSFRHRFISCQNAVDDAWDFQDTAAIIKHCDLIITCDTSIAHLSGGIGKPCWILLKQIPEWRWGLKGDSTPWYPSARLFRQHTSGDWAGVIASVQQALNALIEAHLLGCLHVPPAGSA
jgi:tetratricopeptide (TPR) repeat protein